MKVKLIQTNFRGGEIDPKLKGLVETGRYKGGLETCLNAFIGITGFAERRAGTKFIANSGNVTLKNIPFNIFRPDLSPPVIQGYLVEFRSDNTVHFYTENAYIATSSIPTPFTDGDIDLIRYELFNDILYLVHPNFPPQKLKRTSDTAWAFSAISFDMPATKSVTALVRSGSTATATIVAHGYLTGHVVKMSGANESEYNGDFVIVKIDADNYSYTVTGAPATPATGTIIAGRIYWGATGYPAAITFFEQRLLLGGVITSAQTVHGSESGNILNMVTGVGDSDPFEFIIQAATSAIIHLASTDMVIVSTRDREFSLQGGPESPLTPTNVQIKTKSRYGGRDSVRPVVVGEEFLFPSKHGKKLRALAYRFAEDKFSAPDLSIFSGHLTALGIKEMAFQGEPNSIIWIVTNTGKLLSLTFDRDEEIVAWAQHTADGLFKNVAVIQFGDKDQVWLAVERTINGVTSTYIEVFEPGLNTDAAYTGNDVAGKALWSSGLSHLEGEIVDIVADGVVMTQETVVAGVITLPRTANDVEIGLHYETKIKDLPPEMNTAIGTAQGQAISVHNAIIKLYESIGCEVNGDQIPFRAFGDELLDVALVPFSGDKSISTQGWESGVVTVKQTQPLPLTVLAIIKEVTINGG